MTSKAGPAMSAKHTPKFPAIKILADNYAEGNRVRYWDEDGNYLPDTSVDFQGEMVAELQRRWDTQPELLAALEELLNQSKTTAPTISTLSAPVGGGATSA